MNGLRVTALIVAFCSGAIAQPDAAPRKSAHLLTIGPGYHLFTRFGHIAILTMDHKTGINKVYNFGEFDFNDPQLRYRYIKGDLAYWLALSSYESTLASYRRANRTVVQRTLNLTPAEIAALIQQLNTAALPENRRYRYGHFTNNCCTKVRDVLNDVLGGAIKAQSAERQTSSYRTWTRIALGQWSIQQVGIDLLLGPNADLPLTRWEEQFLPAVLSNQLDQMTRPPESRPLVLAQRTIRRRSKPVTPPAEFVWQIGWVGFSAALLLLMLLAPTIWPKRSVAQRCLGLGFVLWGLIAGLLGTVLLSIWLFTAHTDAHGNENLLVFPLIHLGLVIPGVQLLIRSPLTTRVAKWSSIYLWAAMSLLMFDVLMKIGPFVQNNYIFIALAAIYNGAAQLGLWRLGKSSDRTAAVNGE